LNLITLLLKKFYLSKYGFVLSFLANLIANIQKPFMVYGIYDSDTKEFRKFTRISSSVKIMNKKNLKLADHVWIWHYSIVDATEGIEIEEGVQIGAYVGIFTHGSENSIRLLGKRFVDILNHERVGYTRGGIKIGKYTFVGAGATILPGVTIGKGCLIAAGAIVNKDIPDYSIVVGSPGQVKGSTLNLDERFLRESDFSDSYYDSQTYDKILQTIASRQEGK
jgi:acetyltransferase-like isoleucine patch superfamily enzyme